MRRFVALFTFAVGLLAGASHAVGPQAVAAAPVVYPDRPVRIVVAYAVGQGTDVATRYIADLMAKDLGQAFVIENRPGAAGNLGTEAAARASADGYTLTMGTNATHALNQFFYSKMPFDAEKDFEPIGLVGSFPMVLAAHAGASFASTGELLEAVKRNPRSADIAMPSTTARLVVELLKDRTGAALFGVPYKGSGTAMTDVLGGQLPLIVDTPTALRPHLASGKARAIGVTSVQPSGLVPGVKPIAEQGIGGFEVVAWNALYAPKGTPPAVIAALNASLNKALSRPEVRQKLLDIGFDPAGGSPAQLADFVRAERKKWGLLIEAAGIRAD